MLNIKSDRPTPTPEVPAVFFFVHHFNDIDHLVPVAYKLSESGLGRPIVLVPDLTDLTSDYRLRFLHDQYNVPVVPCHTFHPPNPLAGWLVRLLNLSPGGGPLNRLRYNSLRVLRNLFYTQKWAGHILDRYQPAALVFENSQGTEDIFGKFLLANRKRGTPSIALPHGVYIETNVLVDQQEEIDGQPPDHHLNIYDRVVCQSDYIAKWRADDGVLPEKLVILGSTRYCREWQSINFSIQPTGFKPTKEQGDRLGVVFMFPRWSSDIDFDATMSTLRRLSDETWLHLVIKPHTRGVEAAVSYLKELQTRPNVEIAGDVGSVSLIAWSDAVIVVDSSITLEVLLQGKPHLSPAHLGAFSTAFNEAGAQWTANNDDELLEALKQIRQGSPVPYTKAQVDNVFRRLVLGESDEEDVLGRYTDFVLGGWREFPTYDAVPK